MTVDCTALRLAVDLVQSPSRVHKAKSNKLPPGVFMLLRIAAHDEAAESEAAEVLDRPVDIIRKAAIFFIEQVLLDPEADCYRVLGVCPDATVSELRRNMALLLRGLHPDLRAGGDRSILTLRVTHAWNELKTPDRRLAYDRTLALARERSALHVAGGGVSNLEVRADRAGSASPRLHRSGPRAAAPPRTRAEDRGVLIRLLVFLFGRRDPRRSSRR